MQLLLTSYILVWPVLSLGVLMLLVGALARDLYKARLNGEDMV